MKLQAEPQLYVTDMKAALDHYTDGLGFRVAITHGEPPFWVQIERDGARLNLRHVDGPVFAPAFRETEGDAVNGRYVQRVAAVRDSRAADAATATGGDDGRGARPGVYPRYRLR